MKNLALSGPNITSDRYYPQEDGSVYDSWGRYYVSRELWERRMAEGRSDTARHNFIRLPGPPRYVRMNYFLWVVECQTCGETRQAFVSLEELNRRERWCIAPPTLREIITSKPARRRWWRSLA